MTENWFVFAQNIGVFETLFDCEMCIFKYKIFQGSNVSIYVPPLLKENSYLRQHIYNNYTPCLGTMFKLCGEKRFTEVTDDIREDLLFWNKIMGSIGLNKIKFFDFVSGVYRPRSDGRSSMQKFDLKVYNNTLKVLQISPIVRIYFFVNKFAFGVKKYYLTKLFRK